MCRCAMCGVDNVMEVGSYTPQQLCMKPFNLYLCTCGAITKDYFISKEGVKVCICNDNGITVTEGY